MIVIDTSAIYGILAREPDADPLMERLSRAAKVVIAMPSWLEAVIVTESHLVRGRERLDALMTVVGIERKGCDAVQGDLAADAFRRFGRGSGSRAKLNFGDCFAYALARALDAPLLFKGSDFSHTDIRSAL